MKDFTIYILGLSFILASCGGGGGGNGGDGGIAPAAPKPIVSISSSDTEISINDSITITWSSTIATSCAASGAWTGIKETSGSETFTISSAGANTYTLQCSDASGASGIGSITVNSGYPISIGSIFDSESVSNIGLFIDLNNNLIRDDNEPTFNSDSDGSFEYRSTSETQANCYKKYPTVSNDGALYTPNINQLGNSNISTFSSIYSDVQRRGLEYFTGDSSDIDCNAKNSYWNESINKDQFRISKRVEIYDLYSLSDFNNIGTILSERLSDIKRFQQSAKSIANSLEAEFQTAINQAGLSSVASVRSSYELDTSNFRTFLSSSYPNPSTDLTPVANNIDSVAAQAGFFIELFYPNYMGDWNNYSLLVSDDIKISNNNQVLSNQPSCFINFSSLCIQDATINNFISYGDFTINDIYHKETSRGEEIFLNYQSITDRDTLECIEYDDQSIRNDFGDKYVEVTFSEYRGQSYYYPDDIDCSTFDTNGRGFVYKEYFNDGSKYYMELWDSQQNYYTNREVYFDDYDQDNPLPSEFPISTLEVMATLESYYTNSLGLDYLDSSSNPFNIFTAILNGDIPVLGIPEMTYYVSTRNIDDELSIFYYNLGDGFFYCDSPDISVVGDFNSVNVTYRDSNSLQTLSWNEGIVLCISELDRTKIHEIERPIKNISPFTGVIND